MPVGSIVARRYCAVGVIMRAARELSVSAEDACVALEWQVGRPVQDWNHDPLQTHAGIIAGFDGAIAAPQ